MTTHDLRTAPEDVEVVGTEMPAGPIVVGVDGSPEGRAAANYAAGLAATSGGGLLLAHAYWKTSGPMDLAGEGVSGQLVAAANELVDGLAAELRQTSSAPIETVIAAGKPVPFLSELAGRASTVVVGQDTATLFDRMTFGSVAAHLAATAPCPVVIVPASWNPVSLGEHPVVVMSGDRSDTETLSAAIAEAKRIGTSVLALGVVRASAQDAQVEEQARALAALKFAAQQTDPRVTFETRLVRGHHTDDELVQESADAAAVVVGRPHRHDPKGMKNSVAHAVAKRTRCPLIIVPGG